MRSTAWRNSSMLKTPRLRPARNIASTAASHGAWKTGSSGSRSTGPKPCMPPRSWTPFTRSRRPPGRDSSANVEARSAAAARAPRVDRDRGAGHHRPVTARLVIVFVVDGLRPDAIGPADTPTLCRLRADGVEFTNAHAAIPTVTRVNAATLATGSHPGTHGIVGNQMYVPSVDPTRALGTDSHRRLLEDARDTGRDRKSVV